jgi:hypothetical protein
VALLVRRWLAVALALVGIGFAGFDALLVRPAMQSVARTGRRATGTVLPKSGGWKGMPPGREHGEISVDDPELGPQLADGDGSAPVGARVEVLCSTPERRCERLALVTAYEHWPRTPALGRATALLVAAALVGLVARTRATDA